jgi:hypothetical protein
MCFDKNHRRRSILRIEYLPMGLSLYLPRSGGIRFHYSIPTRSDGLIRNMPMNLYDYLSTPYDCKFSSIDIE